MKHITRVVAAVLLSIILVLNSNPVAANAASSDGNYTNMVNRAICYSQAGYLFGYPEYLAFLISGKYPTSLSDPTYAYLGDTMSYYFVYGGNLFNVTKYNVVSKTMPEVLPEVICEATVDANGNATHFKYVDTNNGSKSQIDWTQRSYNINYENGRVISITAASDNLSAAKSFSFSYDSLGRVSSMVMNGTSTTTFIYDEQNHLIKEETDAQESHSIVTMTYNSLGEVTYMDIKNYVNGVLLGSNYSRPLAFTYAADGTLLRREDIYPSITDYTDFVY